MILYRLTGEHHGEPVELDLDDGGHWSGTPPDLVAYANAVHTPDTRLRATEPPTGLAHYAGDVANTLGLSVAPVVAIPAYDPAKVY